MTNKKTTNFLRKKTRFEEDRFYVGEDAKIKVGLSLQALSFAETFMKMYKRDARSATVDLINTLWVFEDQTVGLSNSFITNSSQKCWKNFRKIWNWTLITFFLNRPRKNLKKTTKGVPKSVKNSEKLLRFLFFLDLY